MAAPRTPPRHRVACAASTTTPATQPLSRGRVREGGGGYRARRLRSSRSIQGIHWRASIQTGMQGMKWNPSGWLMNLAGAGARLPVFAVRTIRCRDSDLQAPSTPCPQACAGWGFVRGLSTVALRCETAARFGVRANHRVAERAGRESGAQARGPAHAEPVVGAGRSGEFPLTNAHAQAPVSIAVAQLNLTVGMIWSATPTTSSPRFRRCTRRRATAAHARAWLSASARTCRCDRISIAPPRVRSNASPLLRGECGGGHPAGGRRRARYNAASVLRWRGC